MNVDTSYIEQTEKYIEQQQGSIPKTVYDFIKQVCVDERRMLQLAKEYAEQKKVLKP